MSLWPALRARWVALSARERWALRWAVSVLGLAVLLQALVLPAWRVLRQAPAQHAALQAQWQTMQRLAQQARALQALPQWDAAETRRLLQASLTTLGPGATARESMDRITVQLTAVPAAALSAWLVQVRQEAQISPVAAQAQRDAQGRWSGSVVFELRAP
ncbi:MAG: hypothetical protein OHK0048_06210 [Rhodoferax sp.]